MNNMTNNILCRMLFLMTTPLMAFPAQGSLMSNSVLSIDEGSFFAWGGDTAISDFAPGVSGDFLTGHDGLILGTLQTASGSHSGVPDGSESPGIDNPWSVLLHTGMHLTVNTPPTVLSASGNTATLDFSGWYFIWNGVEPGDNIDVPGIHIGTGAWLEGTTDGVANVSCAVDCGHGDTYTLIYSAVGPSDGTTNAFGDVPYYLEMHGTISAVPLPASVWLLGSGLLLLAGRVNKNGRSVSSRLPLN